MTKTVVLIFAAGILLLAGCRKQSPPMMANGVNLVDWGVVEFSAGTPKQLSLGNGRDCTVRARPLTNGQLELTIETKENLRGGMNSPGGTIEVPVETSQSLTVSIPGGVEIIISVFQTPVRLIPKIKGA